MGNEGGGIGRNRHEVPRMRICIGPQIPTQRKRQQRPRRAFRTGSVFLQSPAMPAAGSATVLREDGPALLPVEEEREEIDMGKITITEKQEAIIRRLNDPLYTVEFLKEWVNRNDNVFINAPAALQAMGASGFFAAVRAIERAKESDGENT